jgi:hypothetical protein
MATAENFKIILHNSTDAEVKVTKFEYKDGSIWKTENMLGFDGYQKIERYHSIPFVRNLQGIGDEITHFRVTYKHHLGGTKWGPDICEVTDTFTCHDNDEKTVTLTA